MTDEAKRVELLPCPFCGGEAQVEDARGSGGWSVGCSDHSGDCYGYQSLTVFPRKCEAIAAWNRRARLSPGEPSGEAVAEASRSVWLVWGSVGEYSDRSEWPAAAFECEDDAKAFVERMDALGREWWGKWEHQRYAYGNAEMDADEAAIKAIEPGWSTDYTGPAAYTAHSITLHGSRPASERPEAAAEIEALRARVGVLETALEPFALLAADEHSAGANMSDPLSKWFGVAHLQAARQALQKEEG